MKNKKIKKNRQQRTGKGERERYMIRQRDEIQEDKFTSQNNKKIREGKKRKQR